MRAVRISVSVVFALALLGTAGRASGTSQPSGVAGRVLGERAPLASALVYAYHLANLTPPYKAVTDRHGNFLFDQLPAGLYKMVAYKAGFLPAVVMLTRTTAQAHQTLEVQLSERKAGENPAAEDFWSLRARIPGDVLRDIQAEELKLATLSPLPDLGLAAGGFRTEMQAVTGVDQIAAEGDGQVAGGGVGIEGRFGAVEVGLRGRFVQLQMDPTLEPASGTFDAGQVSTLALNVRPGPQSNLSVTSSNNRLVPQNDSGTPVDFEHYQVTWSQGVGENGRSEFSANYTAESNFHRQGPIEPIEIPAESRTWRVEGAYTADLSDRHTLQTGLRYRERQFGLGATQQPDIQPNLHQPGLASIDLFSRGGLRIQPSVLVEYGLYSTLSDGSLSLTPQGGMVFQLGSDWQMAASASRRAYEDLEPVPQFLPSVYQQADLCEQASTACYELLLTRQAGEGDQLSVGAVHRTVGETLRLYFSEDFFDRLQSLYLVRGDEIPELRLTVSRRLSPGIVTRLESNLATGGGGVFLAADQQPYENRIRYLVTSLDTQFQGTSTGVFLAFHQLAQELLPESASGTKSSQELERLQLMVTQDLNFLLNLPSDLALLLNMEISRGPKPGDDELRRRFLGGLAVKF
jgi:hypothetical protein